MLRWSALVLLLAVGRLRAEPLSETLEAKQRELALEGFDDVGFHARGFVQLTGGASETVDADLGVGGVLRYTTPVCDSIRLGGQARLGWSEGARTSAEQWASACIPFFVMEFGHHLEWDVRPSLLAPLNLRAGANRRETVSFHWEPARFPVSELAQNDPAVDPATAPTGELIVFDVVTDLMFLWSAGGPLAQRQTAEAVPFRYRRKHLAEWGEARDFVVDVGSGGGDFIDVGSSVHVWLLQIQNWKLGPLYAGGGGGIVSAGAGPFVDMYKREIDVTTARAMLSVETGNELVHGYLRATHDAAVVPDGYVTVDSRVATGIGMSRPKTHVGLDGAIASTKVLVPGAMRAVGVTGGGSLSVARSLTSYLQATLLVDVARSFYAPKITTLDFTPRWGVEAFAALQATAGN